jgi:hypothetical protein
MVHRRLWNSSVCFSPTLSVLSLLFPSSSFTLAAIDLLRSEPTMIELPQLLSQATTNSPKTGVLWNKVYGSDDKDKDSKQALERLWDAKEVETQVAHHKQFLEKIAKS